MSEPQGSFALGAAEADVRAAIDDWKAGDKVRRLWDGDATLWSDADEPKWLGWLRVVEAMGTHREQLQAIGDDVRNSGFTHALLLGMGGSSLGPEVLKATFGTRFGYPDLFVLDSTVPAQVRAFRDKIDPEKTLFLVSSKSGSTIEPNVLRQYFHAEVERAIGPLDPVGRQFATVTDPGTKMEALAREIGFRHIAHGDPTIGGRFSILSNFGMVPAAIMGLDTADFLGRAARMVAACGPDAPADANPGVRLGVALATLALQHGRDKVTFITSPPIGHLGDWLEQLIAESTGKHGKGLIPVEGEWIGPPDVYGPDRVFVYTRLASGPSDDQDAAVAALEAAGHPVIRLEVPEPLDLGAEFFRWEVATAAAGAVLGINAFDQPDVEAAKIKAREYTAQFTRTGQVPPETPIAEGEGLRLFAGGRDLGVRSSDVAELIAAHLNRIGPGDYFAINAYIEMNGPNGRELQAIRQAVRDARRVATTVGYGPRFLHSTGQLHKGGPDTGVFLQITADVADDLPIPNEAVTFGLLNYFQALGDFNVLAERDRRLLRVHLGPDVPAGLDALGRLIEAAL